MKALNFPVNGFFIDLAANDAVWASNTFALEQHFGWKGKNSTMPHLLIIAFDSRAHPFRPYSNKPAGICIEPNPQYWTRLAFRKCHVLGSFVGANNGDEVTVRLGEAAHGPYSGIVGNDFDNKRAKEKDKEKRYTASLLSILKMFNAPPMIDYLSLDVEGAETFIMKAFPFDQYKFKCLTIERPSEELQQLLNRHGYKKLTDLKRGDTLWGHSSVYDSAKANLAKHPEEIEAKVVSHWPAHVKDKQ